MLTQDTKRHIDAARQILVGVVPNPASQIDQITNALIYKFMDDMDQSAIEAGGKASFFVGDLERYAWTQLMDSRLGNQERMNLYSEALVKFSQAKQLPQLFRDIFKSAFLPHRSPEVLGLFLKEIDYFDYSHSEELGNAYEYLLSIMGSQGDAGQFRTPRHIIDFIVDTVDPSKDDKILDPACGTGGFLISAYKHILEKHDGDNRSEEKPLTPDQKRKLFSNFEGYDVDPGMVRIAQVNMYLHHFRNPKIFNYNTLSQDERWSDKFDVILANPPFMSPKGGVSTHNKFSVPSNRSEVLFVDYIMSHLRPKGRAGIIVPEGIIFQSGIAYKQLRKNLVEDGLCAVVSLPSGVFQPYSGVKTSILLFNNDLAKSVSEILFVKIENDGFDLGATKRPIDKNDLPEALQVINAWKNGKKKQTKLAVYIKKTKIAENGDYNLSGDRYRASTIQANSKWPMVELGEVSQFIRGITFSAKDQVTDGEDFVLVATTKAAQSDGIRHEDLVKINPKIIKKEESYLESGDILISVANSSNLLGRKTFVRELPNTQKYSFGAFMGLLRPIKEKILPKYLDACLATDTYKAFCLSRANTTTNISNLNWSDLSKYSIPLPPIEVQQLIVAELDGYQNIILGARQIVENWKPKIDIDPNWANAMFGEVLNRISAQVDPTKCKGEVFYVGLENIESGTGNILNPSVTKYSEIKSSKNSFKKGHILYGKLRPNLNKVWLADRDGICSTDILVFESTDKGITNFYIYWMLGDKFLSEVMQGIKGAQLPRVGFEHIQKIQVPLPPLGIQEQIAEKIDAERELIESTKKLTDLNEKKKREVLSKLWAE